MSMKKICPECQAELSRVAQACSCGHQFTKGHATKPKVARTEKVADLSTLDPEFACGPTSDGGLMLYWPRRNESYLLTKAEREMVAAVMSASLLPQ